MNHPRFRVLPVFLPLRCQNFRRRNITNRSIKPYIQNFPLSFLQRHGNPPIQVSGHCPGLQTIVQPRLTLPVYIRLPFLMLFQNPLFQPTFILIQRQIPVLCFLQLRLIARNSRNRVYQIRRIQTGTTSLALIPVSPFITTMRTFPHNITVC